MDRSEHIDQEVNEVISVLTSMGFEVTGSSYFVTLLTHATNGIGCTIAASADKFEIVIGLTTDGFNISKETHVNNIEDDMVALINAELAIKAEGRG